MKFVFLFISILLLLLSCRSQEILRNKNSEEDSTKFTYLYSEALKNKMLGQSNVAFKLFIECLQLNPSSTASAYQLALICIDNGDVKMAAQYSDFCLKFKPKNEWYLLQRAEIAKKLNEKDVYSQVISKLAHLCPDNLDYCYEYALILYGEKKYDEALNNLSRIEEEVGINENISFLKNNIFVEINRSDAVQLELLRLKRAFPDSIKYSDMLADFYLNYNRPEKALDIYESIIKNEKDNSNANIGIAWIYGNLNKYSIGYPFLIQSLNSAELDFYRKNKVSMVYLNGNSDLDALQLNAIYLSLLLCKPDDANLINKYISFLVANKDYEQAEKYCKISIVKMPDNFVAWDYFFNILDLQSRYKELNSYSLQALEYYPNHAIVFFFAGYSYYLLKQYNEAISYLENGIDYLSDNNDLEKKFYMFLAECYHSSLNDKLSDQYFEKYLSLDSSNAYIMNNYAFYLTLRNINLEKALQLSRKSIEIEPFNCSFLDTYSLILFELKDYTKALNYIERSYKYGGNSYSVIVEHYGDILFKVNRLDEALERWKEAYSLNRNNDNLLKKINKTEFGN